MSTTENTQNATPFYVVHGTIAQGGQTTGASDATQKTYTPFHLPLSKTPDLDERVRVAHEVLGLVIDAGNSLSQLMAVSHETEGLSSLIDSLLGGAEYARDALVPPPDDE